MDSSLWIGWEEVKDAVLGRGNFSVVGLGGARGTQKTACENEPLDATCSPVKKSDANIHRRIITAIETICTVLWCTGMLLVVLGGSEGGVGRT